PTAPTPALGDADTSIATTGYVAASTLKLVSEAVSTGASGILAVTFPPAAKLVEIHWDCTVNPAANNSWAIMGMAGGALQSGAKYAVGNLVQTTTTVA